ncbi:MAG: lytic murein transglycosylase [Proteobacteria bacterium]|nr:lytic murein transglycosylase [Pseudomonadota bacterium]
MRLAPAIVALLWSGCALAATPQIHIEDAALFYKVYDSAGGHPSADLLQRDYVDKGSSGLRRFFSARNTTADRIAQAIATQPQMYADAESCLAALPAVRTRLTHVLGTLREDYPEAKFPPITIGVGRGKPVAIADETGVMIGLESLCAIQWMNPDVEDRFVHVVAHEYTHVQQAIAAPAFYAIAKPTVLEASLVEGAAEFMGILTSGGTSYVYFAGTTKGHEAEIETRFAADEDKTDLSAWLYNGSMTKPGDLGYWVGRRIVQAYYDHAVDKRAAIRGIIGITDAHAFLAKSGWYPGIPLAKDE